MDLLLDLVSIKAQLQTYITGDLSLLNEYTLQFQLKLEFNLVDVDNETVTQG